MPTVELNLSLLVDIGGWPAMKEARGLVERGRVSEARREGDVIRARVQGAEKVHEPQITLADRVANIEVRCTCAENRRTGRVCPHILAAGLALLQPSGGPAKAGPLPARGPAPATTEKAPEPEVPALHPDFEVRLEGALHGLTLELVARYDGKEFPVNGKTEPSVYQRRIAFTKQPDLFWRRNVLAERAAVAQVESAGFALVRSGATTFSLSQENRVARFLANTLPRWKREWAVTLGPRLESTMKQIDVAEPEFSLRSHGPGEEWLGLDLKLSVKGKPIALDQAEIERWLQTGQSHTRTPNKRVLLVPTESWSEMKEVLSDCAVEQEPGQIRIARQYAPFLAGALTAQGFKAGAGGAPDFPKPDVKSKLDAKLWEQLRPYQAHGVEWLAGLAAQNFHGLLADDMGLGKTLQALAFCAWLKTEVSHGAHGGHGGETELATKEHREHKEAEATELRGQLRSPVQLGNEGENDLLRKSLTRRLPAETESPMGTSAATQRQAELIVDSVRSREPSPYGIVPQAGTIRSYLFPTGKIRQARDDGGFLVVCPTSLVTNWLREAARFTPHLKTLDLTGADRAEKWAARDGHDLLVTSYAILRRDIELYRNAEFSLVILDEAQHIKNRASQNAQGAKALRAQHRLVLTGTPLENSVLDLWSLYDFLLPGYLGTAIDFKERYETPLTQGPDPRTMERLRHRVRPFFLRRTKEEVLTELPPKLEHLTLCELSDEQKEVYRAILAQGRREVFEHSDKAGRKSGRDRMAVLTTLLRLRQVCCHLDLLPKGEERIVRGVDSVRSREPSPCGIASGDSILPVPNGQDSTAPGQARLAQDDELLNKSLTRLWKEPSAKMERTFELIDEAIDGGHRVLLFSQFVQALHLLRDEATRREIPFCYLDGQTVERQAEVDRFQNDARIPIFFISLKAGGTGLNLTGADTVIHFDPWWNPAVEEQATSRAHRMGQARSVQAYKLIAAGTVEEKIQALQARKRELFEASLGSDEAFIEKLTSDDLEELLAE